MKLFFLFFAALMLSLNFSVNAQVSTYSFSPSSGVYTEITGDTVVAFATTTTTSGPLSMDDSVYANNRLPFTFVFNGNAYTNVAISSNGFITFGTTLPSPTSYIPVSATTAYSGAISSDGNDLIGNRGITAVRTSGSDTLTGIIAAQFVGLEVGRIITGTGIPANTTVTQINSGAGFIRISQAATSTGAAAAYLVCSGSIVRGTTGAVGSRVHTIQYKNVRNFTGSANTNCYSYQIKLYETSNLVQIVYGNVSVSTSGTPQVGLRGATNADFNNRTTTTSWSLSTAGATNTATMTLSSTVFPSSGQVYTWTPFVPVTNDVGTTAILNPVSGGPSGSQAPVATIKNFGSSNQTTPFNITCTISPGGYSNTKADTLAAATSKNITFNNFNFAPNTNYTVTVYTSLASDQNHSNDTQRVIVSLINGNYGADSGYFYANNLAVTQPSFPLYCWKDTAGSKSILVNGATSPGNTLVGSVDDGYYKLSLDNILLSFGMDTTDKHLKYNGVCYDSIFPGTNGIVGLTEAFGVTSLSGFNIDGALVAKNALLPMWHDFDLGTLTFQTSNRVSYLVQGNQLIITYDKVAAFAPENDWASFQVVVEIVTGCAAPNSNFRYSFADTTNGKTSAAFLNDYLAQYPAATGSITTFRNYVSGFSLNGGPVTYAAYVSAVNPLPASPSTQLNLKRPVFNLTTGAGLAIEYGPSASSLNELGCSSPVKISVALQGLQSNLIAPRVRDTVTVLIREASPAPYPVLYQTKVLLDSSYNNVGGYSYGVANINYAFIQGHSYYIEVMHRNSILGWSNPVSSNTATLEYDFTTGVAKTFGSNATLINGAAALYTGDVIAPGDAQDGCVDLSDIIEIYNQSSVFAGGAYVLDDLNYDGFVDLSDIVLVYNNAKAFVCKVEPLGALNISVLPTVLNYVPDTRVTILPDPNYVNKEVSTKEEVK